MKNGADLRRPLGDFLGADVEGALQDPPMFVLLAVGVADGPQESAHHVEGGAASFAEKACVLFFKKAMDRAGHARPSVSAKVVIVMVWLWSSQRPRGVRGEISP